MTGAARPLEGWSIVEAATYVAIPSAGLALAQMGAEVIRVDPPGGASDARRWPLSETGHSLFWSSLNKGKRSVAIDHRTPEGLELLIALATRPGPTAGVLLDNLVGRRRPTYDMLRQSRADVIHAHLLGKRNGAPAVDYTVNAEIGVPQMTGPEDVGRPINHVVPAWDLLAGMTVASAVLAAAIRRSATGDGAQVDLALDDVALSAVGAMGWLAEAEERGAARPRHGNHMFGAFGNDFATSDDKRVMVVALTEGQWRALQNVTETGSTFKALEDVLDADFGREDDRYRLREAIAGVLRPWFEQRDFDTVSALLDRARVLWSPYLDMKQAADRARRDGTLAHPVDQAGIGPMLATSSPLQWGSLTERPVAAPVIGADTEAVLTGHLGLTTAELGRLVDSGVASVGTPS